MSATTVSGWVASGYEPVRAAFERLVEDGIETGAGLSVWADGTEVVGLSGGWADTARRRPWRSDTLVTTYSTSKPFAALTALVAVAQGALTLDEPVAAHWKDYACGGKEATTLRDILTHRAGLPVFPSSAATVDMLDDAALRRCLASATAESAPGTNLAEHALTYGHLIDGVLRAATGRSLGEIYAEVVRRPWTSTPGSASPRPTWAGWPTSNTPSAARSGSWPKSPRPMSVRSPFPPESWNLPVSTPPGGGRRSSARAT